MCCCGFEIVKSEVFGSLTDTFPAIDFDGLAQTAAERVRKHGARRATEMREAASMIEDLGLGADAIGWIERRTTMTEPSRMLRTVLGTYPHTLPLKRGDVTSAKVALEFIEVKPTNRAFKPMAMQQAFDVCEMAIVTYLQARAVNKPLVLLPAVMFGRFQHGCMLYNAERGSIGPLDLGGRRIAVRAYAQTTGVWLRGILANDYGTNFDHTRWVTLEDAHVTGCHDPPGVERAGPDHDLTTMLLEGDVDAAIYGADLPSDSRLKSVIPDPEAAARDWYRKHGFSPINHMVVVTEAVARANPQVVADLYQLLLAGKQATARTAADSIDCVPFGIDAVRPALERIIDYAGQQHVIARRTSVDELFEGIAPLLERAASR